MPSLNYLMLCGRNRGTKQFLELIQVCVISLCW